MAIAGAVARAELIHAIYESMPVRAASSAK
jgi:hypothetical protein